MKPIRRREWLVASAGLLADGGVKREVFRPSPGAGSAVMARAWYTDLHKPRLMSIEERWSRSDTVDVAFVRRSEDNGKTWGAPVERRTGERVAAGMLRRHFRGGTVCPRRGVFLEFWMEGVLATDDPLEGLRQWTIYYRIGDGPARPLVHRGQEFDERHPLPGIWKGKTSVMLGDHASTPFWRKDGTLLLPVEITALGPDGKLLNPGGGYTWGESCVLLGRWKGSDLEWTMSSVVKGDPARTTRGMLEPTIAELEDGRLMMVLRGSNDRKHELPGTKWLAYSRDGGETWSGAEPWRVAGGEPFHSPSSCSQLLRHSSGRLFWLGNWCAENPKGNLPRYPFVMAEVDRKSGLVTGGTKRVVDDREQEDNERLMLSNFCAREDQETNEIVLHMTRLFPLSDGWRGDAFLYRIPVK